jgi:hypothetical protein
MSKLLYFLGAGAARPCGYLTTPELYHSLIGERPDMALFREFGSALSDASEAEPIDIEVLYTLLTQDVSDITSSIYERFDRDSLAHRLLLGILRNHSAWGDTLATLAKAFEEARDAILDFIQEKFWLAEPDHSAYWKLQFQPAMWELGCQNVDVFTTNYDTSLEDFFDDIIPFNRGVVDDTYVTSTLSAADPERIRLVKLHGSIDFYELSNGDIVRVNSFQTPGHWKAGKHIAGPYLVPPQMGKIEYDERQQGLFKLFEWCVEKADSIAIIGSSFRDEQVNSVLAKAPLDSRIMVACGSQSERFAETLFSEHKNVTPVTAYFPSDEIEDWFVQQVRGLEIDESGNVKPRKPRRKQKTAK